MFEHRVPFRCPVWARWLRLTPIEWKVRNLPSTQQGSATCRACRLPHRGGPVPRLRILAACLHPPNTDQIAGLLSTRENLLAHISMRSAALASHQTAADADAGGAELLERRRELFCSSADTCSPAGALAVYSQ